MTRDLFQIKRDVVAGAYEQSLYDEALDRLIADLYRHSADRLRVQLPVVNVRIKNVQSSSRVRRSAGSASEEKPE